MGKYKPTLRSLRTVFTLTVQTLADKQLLLNIYAFPSEYFRARKPGVADLTTIT